MPNSPSTSTPLAKRPLLSRIYSQTLLEISTSNPRRKTWPSVSAESTLPLTTTLCPSKHQKHLSRDQHIARILSSHDIAFHSYGIVYHHPRGTSPEGIHTTLLDITTGPDNGNWTRVIVKMRGYLKGLELQWGIEVVEWEFLREGE